MHKQLLIIILIFFPILTYGQNTDLVYNTIFGKETELYRWRKTAGLFYNYSLMNKFNASKVKSIINVLSSDEDRINSTLKDYWKTFWTNKSTETLQFSQRELDKGNQFRANQITLDAKFAQRIADDIQEQKISNFTIESILNNEVVLQGNSIDISKEEVLQGFRKYYSKNYTKIFDNLWKPKDENAPEAYNFSPYLFSGYKILGPSSDLIHTFSSATSHFYTFSINPILFSFILGGTSFNDYKTGSGLSFKTAFNFAGSGNLYEKEYLMLSHNSFKEILDLHERKDIEGLYSTADWYWNMVTDLGYITYSAKDGSSSFDNLYLSLGFGGNYRLTENFNITMNFYYLGLNYQNIGNSFSLNNGTWYYFVSPEISFEIKAFDISFNPFFQLSYQFQSDQRITNLNFGIGIKFPFSEDLKYSY